MYLRTCVFQGVCVCVCRCLPDLELCAGWQVGGQLLYQGQQDRLDEGTRFLAEHLLAVDGLTRVQDQVQVCG